MRHDFNDYVAFMAVAQECSFSRAAVRLGISASTLSHTIRRLEERVGMPLLMRTTRRVAVTEAGKQLLLTLEPGLARIEAGVTALQRLRHTPAGLVRLTVSDHMIHECLWPRLSPLLKKYSDIKVEMSQQSKRTARTVLTGMSYSVGSVMRQGSSSLTRLTGQSAMTSRTWRR
ncbi:TPA: LysR family transcriptional regulator [Klebsiella pneumoniae]|nr:LysR family transcriptional regulator [Klebsiella pneumoniae]